MKITKAASVELSGAPSAEQLEKINRLTKKAVTAEEVYVFSVRLCDDQVDRDDERFSESCIRELAALFIGKTGVMDHVWSAEKQVARIFDTEVLAENGVTYLKGWAYMLRGAETDGLIREIDGGIKKEVSIGCAVKRRMCSICGAEYGAQICHIAVKAVSAPEVAKRRRRLEHHVILLHALPSCAGWRPKTLPSFPAVRGRAR